MHWFYNSWSLYLKALLTIWLYVDIIILTLLLALVVIEVVQRVILWSFLETNQQHLGKTHLKIERGNRTVVVEVGN